MSFLRIFVFHSRFFFYYEAWLSAKISLKEHVSISLTAFIDELSEFNFAFQEF